LEDRQHERTSAAVVPSRPPSPNIANVIDRFTEVIGLRRFAIYVFDYGAPVGFRLAVRHLDRITAIISQNGDAYEERLSDGWSPIQSYWQDPSPANREALRSFLAPATTRWQYGARDPCDGARSSDRRLRTLNLQLHGSSLLCQGKSLSLGRL
jgi:pimeloyl-ACP methyl ester carboxylesterase